MKCCFIGHRDSVGIEEEIYTQIAKLIKMGVTEFYSGGMGNFDKMCEKAVKELGGKIVFVPYNKSRIKEEDKSWYDSIICPFGEKFYSKFDIPNRNKWLVDNCDICLCYVHRNGCAKRTYDYAVKNDKQIIAIQYR